MLGNGRSSVFTDDDSIGTDVSRLYPHIPCHSNARRAHRPAVPFTAILDPCRSLEIPSCGHPTFHGLPLRCRFCDSYRRLSILEATECHCARKGPCRWVGVERCGDLAVCCKSSFAGDICVICLNMRLTPPGHYNYPGAFACDFEQRECSTTTYMSYSHIATLDHDHGLLHKLACMDSTPPEEGKVRIYCNHICFI